MWKKGMNKKSMHGVAMKQPLIGKKINGLHFPLAVSRLNDWFIECNQINSLEVRVIGGNVEDGIF